MKKRVWLGILLIFVFSLCGCGERGSGDDKGQGGTMQAVQKSLFEQGLKLVDLLSRAVCQ